MFAGLSAVTSGADAATVPVFKNCAAMNAKYAHGVGKPGAKDHVTSGKPVTTFYASAAIYAANPKTLDRDKDGIMCEKR